jgi:hypothetical protein
METGCLVGCVRYARQVVNARFAIVVFFILLKKLNSLSDYLTQKMEGITGSMKALSVVKKPEEKLNLDDFDNNPSVKYTEFISSFTDFFVPTGHRGFDSIDRQWTTPIMQEILANEGLSVIYFRIHVNMGLCITVRFEYNGHNLMFENIKIDKEKAEEFAKNFNSLILVTGVGKVNMRLPKDSGHTLLVSEGVKMRLFNHQDTWEIRIEDNDLVYTYSDMFLQMPEYLVWGCNDCKNYRDLDWVAMGHVANHQFHDTKRVINGVARGEVMFHATTFDSTERIMHFCERHSQCRDAHKGGCASVDALKVTTMYIKRDINDVVWGDVYCDAHTPPGVRHELFYFTR